MKNYIHRYKEFQSDLQIMRSSDSVKDASSIPLKLMQERAICTKGEYMW